MNLLKKPRKMTKEGVRKVVEEVLKMDLTFSIVTHNNGKKIKKTLESLIKSIPEEASYKIYLIDNKSQDNTLEILNSIEGEIELISLNDNKGFGYGHNRLLERIDSQYHFIVNPDITLEDKEQIEKMIAFLEANMDVGMLVPLLINPDYSLQHLCKNNPTVFDMLIRRLSPNIFKKRQAHYINLHKGYNEPMKIDYASGSFMVFRTGIFKEIGGFDENFFMYLEDADITRRVNEISKSVFYPQARVIHDWERSAHKDLKHAIITVKSMFVYFNKWGWKWW